MWEVLVRFSQKDGSFERDSHKKVGGFREILTKRWEVLEIFSQKGGRFYLKINCNHLVTKRLNATV
jgi:hypothetical protein